MPSNLNHEVRMLVCRGGIDTTKTKLGSKTLKLQGDLKMPPRILIVDDHEVVRQGVRTILRARPQWEVCGEAINGREAVELAGKQDPDVIIMDITMPEMSGIEATQEITRLGLRPAVLIFTMHESRSLVEIVRQVGARGLVLKSRAARDLIEALDTLMGGGTFFGIETSHGDTHPSRETGKGHGPLPSQV